MDYLYSGRHWRNEKIFSQAADHVRMESGIVPHQIQAMVER